ncbi:MAG TPA: hypothetical protein PKE55_00010 [Kiritimatiellia bacterium]|nr:hypothetical protein [Kiritimatiellia bacterium]
MKKVRYSTDDVRGFSKRMSGQGLVLVLGLALMVSGISATAQITQVASVMNGFGGRSTGGTYTQIGAGAQPGGIAVSYENGAANYAGGKINRAGFLNTFVMFPNLDTNGSGLPNELDPDNDGDGLWDHWEVSGEKFTPNSPTDPNLADTDGNNISDYDESIAGTNPNDPNAGLIIIDLENAGANREVTWTARGNNERIYVVRALDDSFGATPSAVIWSNTVGGGLAPWYETTETIADSAGNSRFYAVEVIRP